MTEKFQTMHHSCKKISLFLGLLFSTNLAPVYAQTADINDFLLNDVPFPKTGVWFNPENPGTGFFIEIQNGILAGSYFGYADTGKPVWLQFSGPLDRVIAPTVKWQLNTELVTFSNGECILECKTDHSTSDNNLTSTIVGTVAIRFTSRNTARLVINDDDPINITTFTFGVENFGNTPEQPAMIMPDLSGQWAGISNTTIITNFNFMVTNSHFNYTMVFSEPLTDTTDDTSLITYPTQFLSISDHTYNDFGANFICNFSTSGTTPECAFPQEFFRGIFLADFPDLARATTPSGAFFDGLDISVNVTAQETTITDSRLEFTFTLEVTIESDFVIEYISRGELFRVSYN